MHPIPPRSFEKIISTIIISPTTPTAGQKPLTCSANQPGPMLAAATLYPQTS